MALLIIFFLVSITFSFLCSLWEASLLTIPPSYVEARSQEGTEVGKILKSFKENVDRPLAAILTLNTIAHTVGAIGVGAQATKIWPGNTTMTGIVVPTVMTLAILILSEIIPKTLGATYWQKLAPFTARTLRITILILTPLVWLSQQITKLLKGSGHHVTMSRGDMAALATLSEREGVIESNESLMMQNLLRSRDIQVKDIMTPRTVMVAASARQSIDEFLAQHAELHFSRIPIFEESIDEISQYVLKDTVLLAGYRGRGSEPLASLARPLITVDADIPMPIVFETLVSKREHIALVLGEFGGTAGIVSQEDVIETLLGLEIVDETDDTVDMQELAQQFRRERLERNVSISPEDAPDGVVVTKGMSAAEARAKLHEVRGGSDFGLTGETPVAKD